MKYSDDEIKQVLLEAYPHLSPAKLTDSVYANRIDELSENANRLDGYRLIGYFDSFCNLVGIPYFAIADTLAAAVTYHDFIPGDFRLEIGMLRSDYMRFASAFREFVGFWDQDREHDDCEVQDEALRRYSDEGFHDAFGFGAGNPTGFNLVAEAEYGARALIPVVRLCEPEVVICNGDIVFGADHLPLVAQAEIKISVFDAVPNDYDVSRALFFLMRKVNTAAKKATGARRAILSALAWNTAGLYNAQDHDYVARLLSTRSKSAPLADLFPVKKIAFGPVEIACPNITTTWVYEDGESLRAQVSVLQADALSIIGEIDKVCRKNGIGYFVCGGTMLGSVRHGGFIPWDDDMDIGMLRSDYERFLQVAPSELSERLFLQTRKSDPNIPYLFSKVRLRDSEYITAYNEFRDFDKGICVDIFPFDKVPNKLDEFANHYSNLMVLIRGHNKVANRQVPRELPHAPAANMIEAAAKKVMELRHRFYWGKSLADTQAAYDEAVTAYDKCEALAYVASFVPTFTMVNLDDLLPYRNIVFEGVTLMAPANPEVFLQMQYGDFMTLPMPHKQRGHGLLRWRDSEHSSEEFEADAH